MKDYFIRLFEYDRYASQIILDTIVKINNPEKPVKLMAHMLAAQQVWINRCKGLPAAAVILWPDWPADTLGDTINENSRQWIDFLSAQQAEGFEKVIRYKDTKGNEWENKLTDILAHVINHGTHHRAQAGQHLIMAGVEQLPITDYIFFIRAMNHWQ
ncbi:MAG TPA: DinB family protein [Mucilaginibacter sp.]|jgi:uncharacterized damage-inducible protein DinB|nr:DinB family protein [Mucilaginibacter sp.]